MLLNRADAVIPSELHQVLDPYINELDKTVGQPAKPAGTGNSQEYFWRPEPAAGRVAKAGRAACDGWNECSQSNAVTGGVGVWCLTQRAWSEVARRR